MKEKLFKRKMYREKSSRERPMKPESAGFVGLFFQELFYLDG